MKPKGEEYLVMKAPSCGKSSMSPIVLARRRDWLQLREGSRFVRLSHIVGPEYVLAGWEVVIVRDYAAVLRETVK